MYRDKAIEKCMPDRLIFAKIKKPSCQEVEQIRSERWNIKKKKSLKILGKIKGLGLQNLAVIVAETNGFTALKNIAQFQWVMQDMM